MRALRAALTLGATVALLLVPTPGVAGAATFTVTNTNDSGLGSLRQAILDANAALGADTITFAVTGTINLASTLPPITDPATLTIDGPGAASLTISGGGSVRVIQVNPGATLDLRDVTVANGFGPVGGGGGIQNNGTLTVTNSTFSGNFGGNGGGIVNGSGGTTLTVANSTFSGNSGGTAGAIWNDVGGTASVTDTTFSGNTSPNYAGAIENYATFTVTNSTFSGNSAPQDSGAIRNNFSGTFTVTNSTFSGNSTGGLGGGILNLFGTLSITSSTFSGNSAGTGGALMNFGGTPLTLRNTIVANSPSGGNCSGVIIDGLGNLQHPGMDCGATIPSADPLLGPLQNNGGPTETMALLPGSPAIDAAVACPPPATDQRGVARPQGAACDIGAFELEIVAGCPPNGDEDDDGLSDASENRLLTLLGNADSDLDGVADGNDDANGNGEDDEDEDDDDDCPDEDSDEDGEDDEDEDDDDDEDEDEDD